MPPEFSTSTSAPRRFGNDDGARGGYGNGGAAAGPVGGRTPPHSVEAEESLLACCLIDGGDSVSACVEAKLTAEAFYEPGNRTIFEVLCEIYRAGHPVDDAVLAEELRKKNLLDAVGGSGAAGEQEQERQGEPSGADGGHGGVSLRGLTTGRKG